MNGENTISHNTLTKNSLPMVALVGLNIQSIILLDGYNKAFPECMQAATWEAKKYIKSDFDLLKSELKEEVKKAKLLLKKISPIKFKILALKTLFKTIFK